MGNDLIQPAGLNPFQVFSVLVSILFFHFFYRYIVSDCDSVDVLYKNQHYTKTPAEAAAISILAGLDLNCGSFLGQHTEEAVKSGLVNEAAIDKAISNNFLTLMRLGFFDGNPKNQIYGGLGPTDVCTSANQELAADAARQGIVLLKNTGFLPLSPKSIKTLAVIGPNANVTKTMIGNYEGTPCKYTTPLQGLAGAVSTTYLPGCSNVACAVADVAGATKLAATADVTVLLIGADQSIEAESRDRVDLNLPGQQQELVIQVAKAAKGPVLLVIMSGGGFDITFAKNDPKIAGILWVGYPGEAGGIAIADIIFGRYNPSKDSVSANFYSSNRFCNCNFDDNRFWFCRWKITDDLVSTVVCRESSDDNYEHETR